jgi:hypothetical protein
MEAAIIMMVILTTFVAPPFLRLVFQESQLETTPSEIPALDAASIESVAVEPAVNRQQESFEDIEAIEERKKGS